MLEGKYRLIIRNEVEFNLAEKLAFDLHFEGEIGPYQYNRALGELIFSSEADAEEVAGRA